MSESNGCGPSGIPNWMKNSYFKEECNLHDTEYEERYRGGADKDFLRRMLDKAGDNKFRRSQAFLYYAIVRSFGWFFYKGRKRDA